MLNRLLFLLTVALTPVLVSAQTTVTGTIRFGSTVRDYRLYVPRAYTGAQPVPLLLNLHGYGSNNVEQEQYGDFRAIADTANFLVLHPNGTVDAAGNRFWNNFVPPGSGGPDDVAFLAALIDSVSARYRVEPSRVYSTGMSNGGFMSYDLACQLSPRIAAIASVTGTMVASRLDACAPVRPVPVLQIHGTEDGLVPYLGNGVFLPIPTVINSWVQRNGCNPTPIITLVPDINTTDGSTAERQLYTGGRNGSVVELYRIIGGGHTWPDAPINTGVTNRDINASREIWRFLRPYRLSGLVTTAREALEQQFSVAPNPARDQVTLRFGTNGLQPAQVQVTDAVGRVVAARSQRANDGGLRLNTENWAPGVYWVRAVVGGQPLYRKVLKVAE
ncbi:extracellular catalytic domain type 1 short-chain-length polyhydroxyalkanoate depolymerase [Hymenobacter perfusus]|uniref:T9SS C-terminal target domain-containing protein n=1 Tax=Hymenobacter perfusus TaxID=1236770 RepID=A0A3R9N6J6_9BACT|nr:PHB depolymerase family esterase [Hymenobacter perfusus]RSK40148.1 T9SS C-terminal target domain-containing protein [Hymenobacter perfusus]